MNFFKDCCCIEELKETYKKLCFKFHPDVSHEENAGEIMKQINCEYDEMFSKLKNIFKNSSGKVYEDKKSVSESPEEFRNIMSILINMKGITIELIGRWIWITGNTMEHKEQLKELNFRWCKIKKAWSWHRAEDCTHSKGKTTLDEIRAKFGSIKVEGEEHKKRLPPCANMMIAASQ